MCVCVYPPFDLVTGWGMGGGREVGVVVSSGTPLRYGVTITTLLVSVAAREQTLSPEIITLRMVTTAHGF